MPFVLSWNYYSIVAGFFLDFDRRLASIFSGDGDPSGGGKSDDEDHEEEEEEEEDRRTWTSCLAWAAGARGNF